MLCLNLFLYLGLLLGAIADTESSDANRPAGIETTRRNAIVQAIEKASPAVVSIHTAHALKEHSRWDPIFDFAFPIPAVKTIPGIGSGFVIREDGYILTNSHVVEGATEIFVTFPDGRRFEVIDVYIDRPLDLAVVQIDAEDLPVVRLGDSDEIIIGEWAIALGNPFGLRFEDPKPTVTVGVISAINRDVRPQEGERAYQAMIQTDASINPGNSGGPLVNSLGEVIGVNTFIFSQTGGSLGIGFAMPINRAITGAQRLIEQGNRDFWTGIEIHDINPIIARTYGLSTIRGALITVIEPLSPGESAGVLPGDVVVEVNSTRITKAEDVLKAFLNAKVGDIFSLTILRGRQLLNKSLILEQHPLSEEGT